MSLKAQTDFNTTRNVRVISPHWLLHPRLILPTSLHAYAPALPSRRDSDTVLSSPPSHPCPYYLYTHMVPSQHASATAYHPYMPPPLLTILMLV
ncbi:hypothetical protein O181_099759 [Austropuccinia psidii MF-1]|uniref:Uncharacterized protein n=1 Tax=Austropuccinia psidii MF-1 TaxID=1389203 RepID=A0A9Q3PFR8_9BASI|nr:hypothetical protein [Austropuccinia psidii MF-1]